MKPYALSTYKCPFSGLGLKLETIESIDISLTPEQEELLAQRGIAVNEARHRCKGGIPL